MPAIWIAIWSFVSAAAVPLVVHLLKVFGLGIVVYTGATLVLNEAESYIFSNYDNLPVQLYSLLTIAGFDAGIKMVFSAMAANLAIKGFTGAGKKKMDFVS